MKTALVGYTGFVGTNLANSYHFDCLYNSKNISEAFGLMPDLLVYSGVPAEMFLANSNPEADLNLIKNAIENIKKIAPQKLVLISTVAVYANISEGNEDTDINTDTLSAYGKNRLYLEDWVEKNIQDHLIVRLPAIYGDNLKKNFIYDSIHFIPSLLKENKFNELCSINGLIEKYYYKQDNGFYKCKALDVEERKTLIDYFKSVKFSALNFTDSRNVYQFFNLRYLWDVIEKCLEHDIKKINIVTEPISIKELYYYLNDEQFENEVSQNVLNYNLKTKYDALFNGFNGYLYGKDIVLKDIKDYVLQQKTKLMEK